MPQLKSDVLPDSERKSRHAGFLRGNAKELDALYSDGPTSVQAIVVTIDWLTFAARNLLQVWQMSKG